DTIYFSGTALYALWLARQRRFQQHQKWVIRHIASGLFIALQRILIAFAFGPFYPPPVSRKDQRSIFGNSGFLGFVVSLSVAEYAIYLLDLEQQELRSNNLSQPIAKSEVNGTVGSRLRDEIKKRTEITIDPLGEKPFTLIVDPEDSISHIKQDIELLTGKPPRIQLLIFENRRLRDTRSLTSYRIGKGSIVRLKLDIKGGGAKRVKSGKAPNMHSQSSEDKEDLSHEGISGECEADGDDVLSPSISAVP
ncbi:MAG: hypothetical protein SGILL_009816, partial [Bacillariaceae sp.]